jgi:hypothetical protein
MSIVNVIQINTSDEMRKAKRSGQEQLSLLTYDLVFIRGQSLSITLISMGKYSTTTTTLLLMMMMMRFHWQGKGHLVNSVNARSKYGHE